MARFEVELPCRWPVARAYNYMADFRNLLRWDPSVSDAELMVGQPGQVGSQFRVVVKAGLRPLTLRYETTTATPSVITVKAHNAWLESVDTVTVTPARSGEGSIVKYEAELRLRGPLNLFDSGLARSFDKLAARAADGLRQARPACDGRRRAADLCRRAG